MMYRYLHLIQVLLILCTAHLFNAQVNPINSTNISTPSASGNLRNNTLGNNNNNNNSSQIRSNSTSINSTTTTTTPTIVKATEQNNTSNSSAHSSSFLNKDEVMPLDTKITVQFSILGALLMLSGAPMAFWGGRNRWSSFFLTGAYLGALIVMIPILRFGVMAQDHKPSNVIQGIFVLACLISAVAAGGVAVIFWKGTRFLVGAMGGFVICLFVLSLKGNSLIPAIGLRWVVLLIGITIGFVLATIPALSIHVTLFATAAIGSAAVVLGIDCFTTGGLKEFWLYIVGFGPLFPKLTYFPFTVTMQAELGVMGGLFMMGAAIQWRLLEIIKKKINELKQLDAERRLQEDAAAYRQSMALDADLALWEKRHGDDGDSMTMTVTASPTNQYHSRKSSQFSLLPLASPSPSNPHQTQYEDAPGSNDRLPSIDSGLGLAGSLGIVEEISDPDVHLDQSHIETLGSNPHTTIPRPRQPPTHRMSNQSQSQAKTTSMLSINFEQSDNDRRFSRPPGAPSSWSRPLSVSKPTSKNPPQISTSNSRFTPSSPNLMHSSPTSKYPSNAQPDQKEQRLRSTSESHPHSTSQRPEHTSRINDSKLKVDTKRHSEGPSRVIIGSYQPPAARSGPPQKRESTIMTVEELDQRHRQAIKKIQHPASAVASADHRQSKEHQERNSVNLKHQLPNSRSSIQYPARDSGLRNSSYLPLGRNDQQPGPQSHLFDHNTAPPSPETHQPPNSNNSNNANFSKSKPSHGWLNY